MDKEGAYFMFEVVTVVALVLGFVYLLVLSIIIHDYKIIVEHPFIFTLELLFMMILPAIPLLFFKVSRGIPWKDAVIWATSLATKFGAFHVVLQLSGFYSFLFGLA
jgi:hypothetical protein